MSVRVKWPAVGRAAARLILAAVFIAAALPKLAAPADFAVSVYRYQVLPAGAINLAALYLPWLELLAAAALFLPRWRDGAARILLALLLVFTAALGFNLARGLRLACGCFGAGGGAADGWNLLRNAGLMVLCMALLWPARGAAPSQPGS